MRPLRILNVESDYGSVGGSLRSLYDLVSALDRTRVEPWVTFARDRNNPMAAEFEAQGVHIVRVSRGVSVHPRPEPRRGLRRPFQRVRHVLAVLRRMLVGDASRCRDLVAAIREHRIDLVHQNTGPIRYAIAAALITRVPTVSHHRSIYRPNLPARWLTRFVDASICISEFVRRTIEPWLRSRRVWLVHNSVLVPDARSELREPRDDPVVVAVGRFVEWKGQHVVIDAVPAVLNEIPGARFRIVGASVSPQATAYERRIKERVRELGLEEHVTFTGFVSDVASIYRDCDLAIHAATAGEPFGLVLVEAMAYGVPLIASDGGACPEIVEPGVSGILVPPGDAEKLAAEIVRVLSDHELARRLAEGGFARVSERFDIAREAREVLEVYESLLPTRNSAA